MFLLIQSSVLLLLFILQTAFLEPFSLAGVCPDLALIFVIYCGFNFRGNYGVGMGFFVGLIQDCLSGGLLGVNTLSKSMVAFSFSMLKDKILVDGAIPICFFIFSASLVDGMIYYLILVTLLKGSASGTFMFSSVFVYALYNAVLGPVMFFMLDKIKGWIQPKFPHLYMGPS